MNTGKAAERHQRDLSRFAAPARSDGVVQLLHAAGGLLLERNLVQIAIQLIDQ